MKRKSLYPTVGGLTKLFGGGGGGEQSKTAKENERLNNQLLKAQIAKMGEKQMELPAYEAPETPKFAPPPSSTPADAEAAAQEARRKRLRARGSRNAALGSGDTAGLRASTLTNAVSAGSKGTLG